jgi:hypothetical protein
MACFSRYGRGLISFNPKKPTGKFHFKVYMLCCAITNLVYKICIHTKDGCDNDVNPAEEDVVVNQTDKLTLDMCKIVRGTGATINMDNYYMSPMRAVNLWKKQIFCCGMICCNRKFLPKSVLFTSKEARELERGTSRIAVNLPNQLVAVGWLDNKAVNFISTADTTNISSVERRIRNNKVTVRAP